MRYASPGFFIDQISRSNILPFADCEIVRFELVSNGAEVRLGHSFGH
jgi:hypothetical protein